jgi:outer membrane protein OmpA-like peptidoglycan-associated protein
LLLLASAGLSYAATGTYLEPAPASPRYILADARDVVLTESTGVFARSSNGQCVRTMWLTHHDACAEMAQQTEMRSVLSREERTVYFGFNQSSLSPQMKARLDTLANVLRSDRQVKGARIVGYADRIGNPSYNEKLSQRRAERVLKHLVDKGLLNAHVADTRWLGSSTSTTDCPGTMKRSELINCLQKDRRVEVEIDYAPDIRASR